MPGLVQAVKEKTDDTCHVTRLIKGNCSVSLEGMPDEILCIDLDAQDSPLSDQDRRCDYLVFADCSSIPDIFAAIELKDGALDASDAIAQLQAGASRAEGLICSNHNIKFRPVVYSKRANKHQMNKLKRTKIRFNGCHEIIRKGKCGDKLSQCYSK